jgi:hypothetical protein
VNPIKKSIGDVKAWKRLVVDAKKSVSSKRPAAKQAAIKKKAVARKSTSGT